VPANHPDWIVRQKIDIPFVYTTGRALTRFFSALREGRLLATHCRGCGRHWFPPVGFCGRCWQPVADWVELSGRGTLLSFATPSQPVPELGERVTYGLVELEGADTRLVHVVHAAGFPLRVGAPVQAQWNPQRSGTIQDLVGFALCA